MEAWPETIGVSVGCFADPDFAEPEGLNWAKGHHRWLQFPEGTEMIDTQPS